MCECPVSCQWSFVSGSVVNLSLGVHALSRGPDSATRYEDPDPRHDPRGDGDDFIWATPISTPCSATPGAMSSPRRADGHDGRRAIDLRGTESGDFGAFHRSTISEIVVNRAANRKGQFKTPIGPRDRDPVRGCGWPWRCARHTCYNRFDNPTLLARPILASELASLEGLDASNHAIESIEGWKTAVNLVSLNRPTITSMISDRWRRRPRRAGRPGAPLGPGHLEYLALTSISHDLTRWPCPRSPWAQWRITAR